MKRENKRAATVHLTLQEFSISCLNIEPDRSGQDGVLMEDDDDEVSKHAHSQAQMDYHMY